MLGRETRVPPGFAVENVARIGASIWSQNQLFLITRKTPVLRSIGKVFGAGRGRENPLDLIYRRRQPERAIAQMMDPVRRICVMDPVCGRMKRTT